jgi:hypothetical protein
MNPAVLRMRCEQERRLADEVAPVVAQMEDRRRHRAAGERRRGCGAAADRVREQEAERLKVRVRTLDDEVSKARPKPEQGAKGSKLEFTSVEPWSEPVNGAELLDELRDTFASYLVLPEHGDVVLSLWTLHTYAIDGVEVTPYLALLSPTKRCGKTKTIDLIGGLAHRPFRSDAASPAAIFRVVEEHRPTLLLDEFDSWYQSNDELRGVLNSGFKREGSVVRCVGQGADLEPRSFATFSAKVIAGIGRLPDTVADRSISLTLQRKAKKRIRGAAAEKATCGVASTNSEVHAVRR